MGSWLCGASADLHELFQAADLNCDGTVDYTEFVAACLFDRWNTSQGRQLCRYAFEVLDEDCDGEVTVEQLRLYFHFNTDVVARHQELFESLPKDRPFNSEE